MINGLMIIIEQILLHIPLLMGAYITFSLLKTPDLSLESAYVTGAMGSVTLLPYIQSLALPLQLIVMITVSLGAGGVVGLCSSMLTQYGRFSHLLSSIITIGLFYGINQLVGGMYISLAGYANPLIMPFFKNHPELVIITIIAMVIIIGCYALFKTQLGYALSLNGINTHFFSFYTINARFVFITGVVLGNMLAGLSGYLFAQTNGFAEINMGFGKTLLCITTLILGKSLIRQAKPISIRLPISGAIIYFILQQLLLKVGFNLTYFTAVQAIVLLLLLLVLRKPAPFYRIDQLGV